MNHISKQNISCNQSPKAIYNINVIPFLCELDINYNFLCFPANFPWFFLDCNKSPLSVDGQKKVPDKGPVMLLYELFTDVHFDCSTVDGAQNNCRFKMTVTVNNSKFDGTGKLEFSFEIYNIIFYRYILII